MSARRAAIPRRLRRALRDLVCFCPTDRPVQVEMMRHSRLWGDCDRDGGRFVVRIAWAGPWTMVDALAHEWAHALTWGRGRPHGRGWAVAYSRCRRIAMKED